jgi:hypothetical protein
MTATFDDRPDIETLAAVIAHSQIIVAAPTRCLPPRYGDIEVAILEWIAAEGRRAGRSYVRM